MTEFIECIVALCNNVSIFVVCCTCVRAFDHHYRSVLSTGIINNCLFALTYMYIVYVV